MTQIGALTNAMLLTGAAAPPARTAVTGTFLEQIERGLRADAAGQTAETQAVSLEDRLKTRYPGLAYHVFDGGSRYWKVRQDFPFDKIYRQELDGAEIENWRPQGPNPDPLDAGVQRSLSSIRPGSKAVIIHPKVQQRMEDDPAYAQEIYDRIEAWFTFDAVRNDAILPGSSATMSQCVAIGEDGLIVNAQACGSSGSVSRSQSGADDEDDFWAARAKRHRLYMQQVVEAQILHRMGVARRLSAQSASRAKGPAGSSASGVFGSGGQMAAMQAAQAAATQTMAMIHSPELRQALGPTLAGNSIDAVFKASIQAIADFHPGIVL